MIRPSVSALLILMALGLSGCDPIGDVLEFGFWLGAILAVLIAGIAYWIVNKLRGRR